VQGENYNLKAKVAVQNPLNGTLVMGVPALMKTQFTFTKPQEHTMFG
jgi:hypothetical protein